MKENEIVKAEPQSPMEMMKIAMAGGADLGQLEKMLTLQEKWDANEARKAYHLAMAEFKKNPPKIDKDKKVSYGKTRYNHASLGNVTEKINIGLGEHGLSSSWKENQSNDIITVACSITHKMGHSESTSLSSPPDNSGGKNSIQAIGSAISYLQRYTLLSLTGLATCDQDDDAQSTANRPVTYLDDKQKGQVLDMIAEIITIDPQRDEKSFINYMKVTSVDLIPANRFNQAMSCLKTTLSDVRKEVNHG